MNHVQLTGKSQCPRLAPALVMGKPHQRDVMKLRNSKDLRASGLCNPPVHCWNTLRSRPAIDMKAYLGISNKK